MEMKRGRHWGEALSCLVSYEPLWPSAILVPAFLRGSVCAACCWCCFHHHHFKNDPSCTQAALSASDDDITCSGSFQSLQPIHLQVCTTGQSCHCQNERKRPISSQGGHNGRQRTQPGAAVFLPPKCWGGVCLSGQQVPTHGWLATVKLPRPYISIAHGWLTGKDPLCSWSLTVVLTLKCMGPAAMLNHVSWLRRL